MLVRVPLDGGLDVPGAQLTESNTLVGVDLADVLIEDVHQVAMASYQGFEATSRAASAELAVIADHDHLRSGGLRRSQQAQHRRVIGEAGLVGDDHAEERALYDHSRYHR